MNYVIKGASVYSSGEFIKKDIFVKDGIFVDSGDSSFAVFDFTGCYVFPGFIDVHVHLREPGFFYKETVETGTMAAACGGYTEVFSMPNLLPVPDCYENLKVQLDIIKNTARVNVTPYGSITVNEDGKVLSDMAEMADYVCAFSDDGKGVNDEALMESAMKKAKSLGKIIAAHCEDKSLIFGGYIHDGEYARLHNHKGIPSESEWKPIERDIKLCEKTGASYHVCHVSAKESVELIRQAKKRGVDITCETAPHYLVLDDSELLEEGRFKMNPPVRSDSDKLALIEGIKDGTIDMIATDHAPHSAEEKGKGLEKSLMGVVGLETAFPVLYTELVKTGTIKLEKLIELMHGNPKKRFGKGSDIGTGKSASFTVFDLKSKYVIDSEKFLSKGKSTPFDKKEVFGKCLLTAFNGEIVWKGENN